MRRCLLFLLLSACYSVNQDIAGSDREMLLPTFRSTFNVLPAREGEPPKTRGVLGVEVNLTGGEGDFLIDLAPGSSVQLNETRIFGPASVLADFTLFEASVAARGGVEADNYEVLGIAGLAYNRFGLDLSSGTQQEQADVDRYGPILGFQAGWEPIKRVQVYGRATLAILLADGNSGQFEVGFNFGLSENVRLLTAYRWWRYRVEDRWTNVNDIDVRAGGVVFGVALRF
jgi:hypothetical protein